MCTSTPRLLAVGLLVAGVLLLGSLLVTATGPDPGQDDVRVAAAEGSPQTRPEAVAVLREWDRARGAAWRRGDIGALRRLYLPQSTAGRADRRLLAAYVDRGLRVSGVRMQVASVHALAVGDDRITVVVTDRLAGATAHGDAARVELPHDDWSRRRVVLVRTGTRWRVAEASDRTDVRPGRSPAPP